MQNALSLLISNALSLWPYTHTYTHLHMHVVMGEG